MKLRQAELFLQRLAVLQIGRVLKQAAEILGTAFELRLAVAHN
jgi:hypothetical protein